MNNLPKQINFRQEKEEASLKESPSGTFSYYYLNKEIYEKTNNKNERRDTQKSIKKKD